MSSTNRGHGEQIRHEDDFYETPEWCTRALLRVLSARGIRIQSALDPFAGRGAILDVIKSEVGYHVDTKGFELNAGRAAECSHIHACDHRDALADEEWYSVDLIVTNPPFFLALEGIQRAITEISPIAAYHCSSTLAFLLRLNFLGAKKRADFHRDYPAEVLIMSERPSFRPDGKTDSIEYAWFLWGLGAREGRWEILTTSRKEK